MEEKKHFAGESRLPIKPAGGDRSLVTSLELRAPLTLVLNGAKLGVTAFVDAGKIWDFGQSLDAATWRRGAGGGVFLIARLVRINLDVADGIGTGKTRVHFVGFHVLNRANSFS